MGPGRQLLQAENIRPVGRGEANHLLEMRVPLGRLRVAMEDVPGTDDPRQSGASLGACFGAAALLT